MKFILLIISLYIASILFGTALSQGDVICLFGASMWIGISLYISPIFRKKEKPGGSE